MPEPTPTVIVTASDRRLAEKILMPRQVVGVRRHQQPTIDLLAAEIAAAREAWGVPREAVAGLVDKWEGEAATYPEHGALAAAAVRLCAKELRAALERVKEGGSARE